MKRWHGPLALLMGMSLLYAQQEPLKLQILVIGGEGSINNVKQRTAREPVVEVRDQNNRPVAGAVVLFESPGNGASGSFIGGARTLRVTTDAQGRAAGQGFSPNNTQGNFDLQVTASAAGVTATTVIHMQNAGGAALNAAHAGHGKLIGILVAVGAAAAAGGAYAATHAGNGAATPTLTTITAGTGSVGGRP